MMMRVTTQTQMNDSIANIQRQSASVYSVQSQLTSGLRVQNASDDPGAFSVMAQAKAASQQFAAYSQTMTDSTTTLNAGVSALTEVNDVLTSARAIAVQGADSSTNAGGYTALANQVDSLISRAMAAANTQVDGSYLFSGAATGTQPFQATVDANGKTTAVAYNGSTNRARALIGPGQTVDTRYTGDQVFQKAGGDVFKALITLRDNLRNPANQLGGMSQALNQSIGDVTAAASAVQDATSEQSSSLERLSSTQNRVQDLKLAADQRVGQAGGTDYASAIVQMQEQENALQASLSVTSRILQPNLINFVQ